LTVIFSIPENPKAARQLSVPRQPKQDTNKACTLAWQGESVANFYQSIEALRKQSKECFKTKKLIFLKCIGDIVLEIFFNVKSINF
jgi:hypothetical protein